jgi:uncharacterized protein
VAAAEPQTPPSSAPGERPAASAETAALAEQARGHYDRAIQAQREGNWALYGEEIRKLGEVLQRMRNR